MPEMNSPTVKVIQGDALERLRELPSESVHCVVTSPPFWGLRDYSRCKCGHRGTDIERTDGGNRNYTIVQPFDDCPICNGTGIIEGVGEHQLGLEKTPEEYVQKLVEVFREVRRVLRDDGTLWLNLGDSYNGSQQTGGLNSISGHGASQPHGGIFKDAPGLKPKDLVGIPWRVAFALQADGWYLRSDIIWSKPNPMPESVRDRPTKSHEYIFLLTKSDRYYFDQEAVRENNIVTPNWAEPSPRKERAEVRDGINPVKGQRGFYHLKNPGTGRNIRSVWTMTTQPYPEAHFATYPPELPERCIKAGTSLRGCCPGCGAPYERVIDYTEDAKPVLSGVEQTERNLSAGRFLAQRSTLPIGAAGNPRARITTGWQPTCSCGIEDTVPCTVLDPFAGSGTTGQVARNLGRSSILIELNPEYINMIRQRTRSDVVPLGAFAEIEGTETSNGIGV